MKTTKVFKENAIALSDDSIRFIINKGGTRSSKSFSVLQLIYYLASVSKKPLVIHCVSHSSPHLEHGIVADFDKILLKQGIEISKAKKKHPNTYRVGNSVIIFLAFDKIGKALGAAKDILFINEANKMTFDICHQLMQRATSKVFIDYNPASQFWLDDMGYAQRADAKVIHSTFRDNIDNISDGIIADLHHAKIMHDKEVKQDQKAYWYNFWRVYGLGLDGITEGVILPNWVRGEFPDYLPYAYACDFGYTDPFTVSKMAIDNKARKIYVQVLIYKSGLSTERMVEECEKYIEKDVVMICDCANPTSINDLQIAGFEAIPCVKPHIVTSIQRISSYQIVVCSGDVNTYHGVERKDSVELEQELLSYVWVDNAKKLGSKQNVPIDKYNHVIDPIRYFEYYVNEVD